jgi:hypothetical protein
LDWDEASIYNMLTLLENQQRYNCAKLREKGYTEAEIQRLDALWNQNVTDFSHIKRGPANAVDED